MKSKYITHIILEGCDGVGKDTICSNLWRKYNFEQRVYVRGEISDYVYAQKYNRKFITTQRGLPFLYVVLIGDKEEIKKHIYSRHFKQYSLEYEKDKLYVPVNHQLELTEELKKISDNELFRRAANILCNDYHIITIYCENKTVEQLVEEIYNKTKKYIDSLENDKEINEFNKMYELGCKKCGIKFSVKGNQPFFDNKMVMADAHLHNGDYETYSDKTCPHNLIFSLGYDISEDVVKHVKKTIDFCYPINSKILWRKEVYDYFNAFDANDITFLTTDSQYIPNYYMKRTMPKVFGNDYIEETAKCKATIYTARDLIDINMITVRPYEAVLANQVIFFDVLTDFKHEIFNQIYDEETLKKYPVLHYLRVMPYDICSHYKRIFENEELVSLILKKQNSWYKKLKKNIIKGE